MRIPLVWLALLACQLSPSQSKPATRSPFVFPPGESLSYGIEWRLIYAGSARLSFAEQKAPLQWESKFTVVPSAAVLSG